MASIKALAAIALTLMIAAPIGFGYMFATEDTQVSSWESENRVNLSDTILNSEHPIYMDYTGTSNNTTLDDGENPMDYNVASSTVTSYPITTVIHTYSINFPANTWVDLSDYSHWAIEGTSSSITYWLNGDDDTAHTKRGHPDWLITGNGGSLKFGSAYTFNVMTYSTGGQYADVNGGWKLPNTDTWFTWTNNQVNQSVKILLDLHTNSRTDLQGPTVVIARDNYGVVTVEERESLSPYDLVQAKTLGNYQYVLAERNPQGWTFSGLTAWPNMTSNYQTYNTVDLVLERTAQDPTFTTMELRTDHIYTTFRVDSAMILSGSFPDTEDYTLDMNNLFPGKSYTLKFNSIGIYGTSLTIGEETFTVTNGRITIDDSTVALKGAIISSKLNGEEYEVYINNHEVGTSADPASITFNGEWSLTITAELLKTVEYTSTQWAPGEFAFDKTDFAACGLLVAGALLVGLGMYGQRSGIKFGVLLLICGGAALAYLSFV